MGKIIKDINLFGAIINERFDIKTYPYRWLPFEIKNDEELRRIVTFFHTKYGMENNHTINFIVDYVYRVMKRDNSYILLVDINTKRDEDGYLENDFRIESKTHIKERWTHDRKLDKKIYTIDDLRQFDIAPNYSPRRITRTLESVSEPQYRFKTRREFIKDFGDNYKTETGWGLWSDMDYLFGTKLEGVGKKEIELGGMFIPRKDNPSTRFYIDMDWLTTEPIKPDYSPRRFDRTVESVGQFDGFDVHSSLYFRKYNAFVAVFDKNMSKEEYVRIITVISDMFDGCAYQIGGYLLRLIDEVRNQSEDYFYIMFDYNRTLRKWNTSWCHFSYLEIDDAHKSNRKYSKPFYYYEINKENMLSIMERGQIAPTYKPRKIDRTVESIDENKKLRDSLSKGEYTCINFIIHSDEEKDEVIYYLKKLGIIGKLNIIGSDEQSSCFTFFTEKRYGGDFGIFEIYKSDDGEHMENGEFQERFPYYKISPLFSIKELKNYINKFALTAKNMYAPRKIDRKI